MSSCCRQAMAPRNRFLLLTCFDRRIIKQNIQCISGMFQILRFGQCSRAGLLVLVLKLPNISEDCEEPRKGSRHVIYLSTPIGGRSSDPQSFEPQNQQPVFHSTHFRDTYPSCSPSQTPLSAQTISTPKKPEPTYQAPARQLESRLASVAMKEAVDSALIMVAAAYRPVATSRCLCETLLVAG